MSLIIEPVALSRDVPAARVMRAQLGELDLAVWRSESGVLSAWENRCPHRGMRLSHGFVRGERLACLYHGWHYSTQGFCEIIPAHPELTPPKTFCTVQYGVVESAGVIWVSNQRTDNQDIPPPSVPDLPAGLQPVRSIRVNAAAPDVIAAFNENPPDNKIAINSSDVATAERILQFGQDSSNSDVILLLQHSPEPDSISVNVHVLGGANNSIEDQIQLSHWCESVRRIAEQSSGATQ